MDFSYVVGRHSLNNGTDKTLAGFIKLEPAKDFAERKELDYLNRGYMYVDSPEGRYIYGAEIIGVRTKWYSPNEKVFVYDARIDEVVDLASTI